MTELLVRRTEDFELTGRGDAAAWNDAPWVDLVRVGSGAAAYKTRAKVMYSPTGVYVLADCEDKILTADMTKDFDLLFTQDVVEVFLWPEPSQWTYFEYEISPLDVELPLMVVNSGGPFNGWLPFNYGGLGRVRHATAVRGGERKPFANIDGWSCEMHIPYSLLRGLQNTQPTSGTLWRANIYRIDYDNTPASQWAWCPDTDWNFHDFRKFGTWRFE